MKINDYISGCIQYGRVRNLNVKFQIVYASNWTSYKSIIISYPGVGVANFCPGFNSSSSLFASFFTGTAILVPSFFTMVDVQSFFGFGAY